jgi:hypothetical protein
MLLEEITLDKVRYNYFVQRPFIIKPSVFVFFTDYNTPTVLDNLIELNIPLSKIRNVYLPKVVKNYRGVTVNTNKIYPDILKILENEDIPVRLIKTLPKKLEQSILTDLNPILYQLKKVFDRLKFNKFDLYFEIVDKYVSVFEKYDGIDVFPVLYLDANKTSMDFVNDLVKYLIRKEFKINGSYDKLYAAINTGKKTLYTLIGIKKDDVIEINKNAFYKALRIFKKAKEELVDNVEKEITQDNVQKLIDNTIRKYNITKPDVKTNIKTILQQYIGNDKEKINLLKTDPELAIQQALKDVTGADVNIKQMNKEDIKNKLEEIGGVFIKPTKIQPSVNYEFTKIIPLEEEIQVETTIVDRHKKEFDKLQDFYIEKIFKNLETGNSPVKIKKIKKELRDNNVNRVYRYTITVEDKNGNKYDLNINMPALINERYFKLNGKPYILVNQLFLKPITKANHNSVRFLSNYATVTLELRNAKLPVTNINEILDYIVNKYSNHIKEVVENKDNERISTDFEPIKYKYIEFDNGYTFYGFNPAGNNEYIIFTKVDKDGNEEFTVYYNDNTKEIYRVDPEGNEIKIPLKFKEYVVNKLQKIISDFDINDLLAKSLKSVPYIQIHIAGVKMPFIKYMILNYGLVGALNKLNIPFKVSDNIDSGAYYHIQFKDKVVNIYPTTLRQRYIVNGLKLSKLDFKKYNLDEFENDDTLRKNIFIDEYGAYSVKNFDLIRQNIVDTITKELLEYENRPTNFDDILVDMSEVLFTETPTSPVDLRTSRARLSEILHNILYKQIAMAKNDYEVRAATDKTAKIYIDPDYVIKQLLQGESTLQYTEPVNPIDELNTATRITPTGIGGVPKPSIQLIHRLIPIEKDQNGNFISSYYGNISALDTNEYSNVGINQELTYQSLISDKFGLFGLRYNINDLKFETLGIGESLAPWISSIDHDRTVKMAQQMRQTMPLINPDPPLVQSGAESLIPQMSSTRFTIKAEDDGVVKEVKDGEYILVEYKNGKQKLYDIRPRLARLKRGKYIPLDLHVNVKPGDKIKKNQIIAGTTQTKTGLYSYGKNVVVALMPYNGGSFEDGWVITEDTADKFKHKVYEEVDVLIPDNVTVDEFISEIGKQINKGDVLVKFSFANKDNANEYMNEFGSELENEEVLNLNNKEITIESPIDGVIKDIRIYINGNVDPKIESAWNKIAKQLKTYINKASKVNGKDDISYLDNIDTTMFKRGSHKYRSRLFKGARVLFLIETERKPTYGDKFVFRGGNKGTVTYIIPKDKKPKALSSNLDIDWIHNSLSVIGRKNANILLELGVGKVLYFLNKKAKELANDSKVKTKDIKKLVLDVYNALDQTEDKKYFNKIKEKITSIPDNEFRNLCKQIDPLNKPLFVWLAIPFSKMKVDWINDALDILGIPLEEYVYIPELNAKTNKPVTVGIAYATMLEYMPDIMLGYRSTEKYSSLTGQAVKGKSNEGVGGARIDELTLAGLIDYLGGNSKLIEELYTVQADDHTAKEDVQFQIIQNGEPPEQYKRSETKTKTLLREFMYGMGLNPNI